MLGPERLVARGRLEPESPVGCSVASAVGLVGGLVRHPQSQRPIRVDGIEFEYLAARMQADALARTQAFPEGGAAALQIHRETLDGRHEADGLGNLIR